MYTLATEEAAGVSADRLARVVQRQQREGNRVVDPASCHFVVDVPVSEVDVERWGAELRAAAPSPAFAIHTEADDVTHDHVTGDGATAGHFAHGLRTARAVMDEMPSVAQRQAAVHALAPLPPFDPGAVVNLPMTRVLKVRREWLPYRQRFAVYQQRMPLLDALLSHVVVALVGGPGSGRTLQTPLILAETDAFKRRRIVVVSANAVAAQLTAHRLREERGEGGAHSGTVAVALPGHADFAVQGTSVLVTTAEVLLRQLLCDPTLVNVGCVIVDDVHVRNETTELCLAALRELLVQHTLHDAAASSQVDAEATATSWRLRVVLNCPDDATATTLLEYFAAGATPLAGSVFSLLRPESAAGTALHSHYAPTVLLHLDETVQWLSRCEHEGSTVCKDPDTELAAYATHVDVVARIMAAADADFDDVASLHQYWCALVEDAVRHYDAADRAAAQAVAGAAVVNAAAETPVAVVVIVPNVALRAVETELRRRWGDAPQLVLTVLTEQGTEWQTFLGVAQRNFGLGAESQRQVLLTTPELAQTVLPSTLQVGLVVDCARDGYRACQPSTMTDACGTEYSTVHDLRQRRSLGKVMLVGNSLEHQPTCMVLQLIPKSVLHGPAHRRVSTDASHHRVFRLSLERYVQLYLVLLAQQEQEKDTTAAGLLSERVASLLAARLLSVPAATSARYETIRRIFLAVEEYVSAAHYVSRTPLRLQPLGLLVCCLPYSTAVGRMLVMGVATQCVVAASAVAAVWETGDVFAVPADEVDARVERAALLEVARGFFARDSHSDTVAAWQVYTMWLGVCDLDAVLGPNAPAVTQAEDEFLAECRVSRAVLMAVARRQLGFLRDLHRRGWWGQQLPHDPTSWLAAVARHMRGIAEDALTTGSMPLCLTAALYPRCALVERGEPGALVLDVHDTTVWRRRCGVFADAGVRSGADATEDTAGPVVFLDKVAVSRGVAEVAVLVHTTPMQLAAAVVVCGDGRESVAKARLRCRGWTTSLTAAWRHTRRARQLPPPAQLPPCTVSLQPYDTLAVGQVVVGMDERVWCGMRATSARWLWQLRAHLKRHLAALAAPIAVALDASSAALANAWAWWLRRESEKTAWLREERRRCAGVVEVDHVLRPLYGFYVFSTTPGTPAQVSPPQQTNLKSEPATREAVTGYTGALPSPDVDHIFRMCVKSVAAKRTREAEAQLLRDNPDMFAFLDPENELHPYYLFLLRQAAPDLEVLGDDLDELVEYLRRLETTLREELGVTDPVPPPTTTPPPAPAVDVNEVAAEVDEVDVEDDVHGTGLQLETAAVSLQRRTAEWVTRPRYDRLQHDPTAVEPVVEAEVASLPPQPQLKPQVQAQQPQVQPQKPTTAASMQGIGKFTFAASNAAAATPDVAAREPTLMEKLMAMQSANAVPTDVVQVDHPSSPDPIPTSTAPTSTSVSAPLPTTTTVFNESAPAAPTTEELLALLANTVAAPVLPTVPVPPSLPLHPLAKPPPPLPRIALDSRTPSVLVYPLPAHRHGNVCELLTRALSRTMTLRVGPARIVGRVARIEVPNRKVEARALSLKSFVCLGSTVFILRNDRIVDNPSAAARGLNEPAQPPVDAATGGESEAVETVPCVADLQAVIAAHDDPVAEPVTVPARPTPIGVFSDSDDDDDEDEERSSSSSSSSASSSDTTSEQANEEA